jgi:hypothetical protein
MPRSSVKLCIFFGVWRNRGFNGAWEEVGSTGGVNYTKRLQRLILFASLLSLALAGCGGEGPWFPVPRQHEALAESGLPPAMVVDMASPDAPDHIVSGIYAPAPGVGWRWTEANPAVWVMLERVDRLRFTADFAIWDEGFKQTGPVTVKFLVNGHVVGMERYTAPGVKHFEAAVPDGWVSPLKRATAAMAIDKVYVSPADQKRFGVILVRIGFRRAG